MDFAGQKLAETLGMLIISGVAVIGFFYGYVSQDFHAMMTIFGSGVGVAFVVSVPDWPMYNKHPVKFLPPKQQEGGQRGSASGSGKRPKKKSASWSNLWGMF